MWLRLLALRTHRLNFESEAFVETHHRPLAAMHRIDMVLQMRAGVAWSEFISNVFRVVCVV